MSRGMIEQSFLKSVALFCADLGSTPHTTTISLWISVLAHWTWLTCIWLVLHLASTGSPMVAMIDPALRAVSRAARYSGVFQERARSVSCSGSETLIPFGPLNQLVWPYHFHSGVWTRKRSWCLLREWKMRKFKLLETRTKIDSCKRINIIRWHLRWQISMWRRQW